MYKPEDYPQRTDGFVIPVRTQADLTLGVYIGPEEAARLEQGQPLPLDMLTEAPTYTCVDCRFQTRELADIVEHQEHQAKYHTWWQRLRRFLTGA
ncbi:MAG: hypothetical protein Q8R28_15235 [Dehalococcoidia bacterium]|nr:hypothetical protein [Dehalococcoidia bacterium]